MTKNLMLRALRPVDITDAYVRSLNDPEIVQFTGAQFTRWNKSNVKAYVKSSNIKNKSILLGVFLKTDVTHIGNIRLFNFDPHHRRVELGIMIFDKTQWGKGYGSEALQSVIQFVFKKLKLHRICADYYSVNKASARMFKKVGFKVEGVFKDHFILNDRYVDSIRIAKVSPKKE